MTSNDIVRAIYADFAKGNVPAILERMSADIAWDYAYPDRGIPWLTPRRGREGVGAFFASLGALEFTKFEVTAVVGDGDLVVALASVDLVVRATGKHIVEEDEAHIWRFDRRGQVVQFRHAADTAKHLEALRG